MSHPNARLTVRGLRLIVARARAGWAQAHIAAGMGISRRCVRRWLARYAAEGEAGLHDRSSRPHRCPRRTSSELEAAVLALRAHERLGRDAIARRVGLAPPAVSRILARHRRPHLSRLDPRTGRFCGRHARPRCATSVSAPASWCTWTSRSSGASPMAAPGGPTGAPATRSAGTTTRRSATTYVHALVDDHSRLAYAEVLPDERGTTCAAFLERAIDHFAAHGITRIERLLTDIQTRSRVSGAPAIGRWWEDANARPPSTIVV